jgi:D-alanyl-lipoteichoic acid acyltransferase DltB (MBOAT superfamily)
MLFTSFDFFLFLSLTLAVFALCPPSWRWAALLLASYVFYGWMNPANLLFLGGLTIVVLVAGEVLGRLTGREARWVLVICLVAVLGSLTAFKFYDFTAGEIERLSGTGLQLPRLGIAAPAGYSFYAFSAASYLIDVYLRRIPGPAGAGALSLYLAFFPKIFAGPIERATTFLPQLAAGLRGDPERCLLGTQLIIWGLFKKVVIADNLAPLVDRNFSIAAFASPMELLVSVYFFAFQIYCDFSGYTDIAIGIALLFGLVLMENFRRPYLSRSVAEFWAERWHISLGHWFRDYLYFPLGGSRVGAFRFYFNIMAVFVVSGLWHAGLGYGVGWTFLVWGALNGLYVCAGRMTKPFWRIAANQMPALASSSILVVVRIVFAFHLVAVSWIFFRAASVGDAVLILKRIAAFLPNLPDMITAYPFTTEHVAGFGLIALLLAVEVLDERRSIWQRLADMPVALRWSVSYAAIFALILFGRWQAKEFIYMQF